MSGMSEGFKTRIEVGQEVRSTIVDRGALPSSFSEYAAKIEGEEPFSKIYGLGVMFSKNEQGTDPDLERFFGNFPYVAFVKGETEDSATRVIADIEQQIVEDFRTTELFKSDPDASWQLYGEFSVSSVSAEDLANNRASNPVSDELAHVDFVPPEEPCATFFASSKLPTRFREGAFTYRGNIVSDYADGEHPIPELSPIEKFPSGHLIYCEDSRTALHEGDLPDEGYKNRILLRVYIAKKK